MGMNFFRELRMYNPEYLERPYVVVLNKIDKPEVCGTTINFSVFVIVD